MRCLDLFSGVGGFSLGMEAVGFETVAFSEIEPFPCRVLEHRWPNVPNFGDVWKIKGEDVGAVDVITAGFPCQDLSVAGKRRGLAGSRSGLFWQIVRLAEETRAPWLVLENVPGLLSSNEGRDFGIVLNALGKLGYGLSWRVLDAQYFGVPQRRRRVFVVGCLGTPCPEEILFEPEGLQRNIEASGEERENVAGCLSPGAHPGGFNGQDAYTGHIVAGTLGGGSGTRGWAPDTDRMTFVPILEAGARTNGDGYRDGDGIGEEGDPMYSLQAAHQHAVVAGGLTVAQSRIDPTLSANEGGTLTQIPPVQEGMAVRRLTPLECERLQGFPDNWTNIEGASDSGRYRAMGNAVAVPVVEWIARRLAKAIRKVKAA